MNQLLDCLKTLLLDIAHAEQPAAWAGAGLIADDAAKAGSARAAAASKVMERSAHRSPVLGVVAPASAASVWVAQGPRDHPLGWTCHPGASRARQPAELPEPGVVLAPQPRARVRGTERDQCAGELWARRRPG